MNFRKFRKSTKALSPVVASIILIAVTVAVSVVVAAWMGGMSLGLMGGAEQLSVTNVHFSDGDGVDPLVDEIVVSVKNSGGADAEIKKVYINGVALDVEVDVDDAIIEKGGISDVRITFDWDASTSYSMKFTTANGNNVEYSQVSPATDATP